MCSVLFGDTLGKIIVFLSIQEKGGATLNNEMNSNVKSLCKNHGKCLSPELRLCGRGNYLGYVHVYKAGKSEYLNCSLPNHTLC